MWCCDWTYEDYDVEERVCSEAVRAMDADTSCFACGIQAVYDTLLSISYVEYLTMVICGNTAHTVVHCRQDGNRLLRDIDACKNSRCFRNTW
jgi:hypothetical protein